MSPFPVPFRTFSATAGLLMLAIAIPFSAAAQAQAAGSQAPAPAPLTPATSAAGKLTFEVASVRPSTRKFVGIGMDFLNPLSDEAPPKGGLFSWNVPFISLVDFAYDYGRYKKGAAWRRVCPVGANAGWVNYHQARADGIRPVPTCAQWFDRWSKTYRIRRPHGDARRPSVWAGRGQARTGTETPSRRAPCALSSSQTDENTYPHAYPGYKSVPARCGVFNREVSHFGRCCSGRRSTSRCNRLRGQLPCSCLACDRQNRTYGPLRRGA